MIQLDLTIVFWGEGEVFVVISAFKSVTSKVDMVTSIFFNIFVQDRRRIIEDCFLLSGIFIVGKIKGGRNSRASRGLRDNEEMLRIYKA